MRAKLLGATIAALCLLGILAAGLRVADVAWRMQQDGAVDVSPVGRLEEESIAAMTRLPPGSADHRRYEAPARELAGRFGEHPGMTMLHMIPGMFILALAPWQFLSSLRRRHPALHRWSGRALLAMAFAAAASAAFFGFGMPFGGATEAAATALFGTFFVFAGVRGWIAIRAGDVVRHRAWMTRMFAIPLGVAVMRALGIVLVLCIGDAAGLMSPAAFGIMMWVGWIVTLAAAELHIRGAEPEAVR